MNIKMPDGTVVAFPDTMPKEQIQSLIRSKFPDAVPPQGGGMLGAAQGTQQVSRGARDVFAQRPEVSGSILPITAGQDGVRLDMSAGLPGSIGRALSLPGDVYSGKVNPLGAEGVDRAREMAMWFAGANPAVRSGDFAIPGAKGWQVKPAKGTVPTTGELLAEGGDMRNAARRLGVEYDMGAVVSLAGTVEAVLAKDAISAANAPQTIKVLRALQKPPSDPTAKSTYLDLETVRDRLGQIAQSMEAEPRDRMAATRAIAAVDEFVRQPRPQDVMAGPAAAAGELQSTGNANYAAGSRAKSLEAIAQRSQLRSESTGSGTNYDNTVRQKLRAFIEPAENGGASKAQNSGFTPSEIAMMRKIVAGSIGTNRLRDLGNLLGGTVGTGIGAGSGAVVGGVFGQAPAGAAIGAMAGPVVGRGFKFAENTIAKNAVNDMSAQLRSRSPLAAQRIEASGGKVPTNTVSAATRATIIRMLLSGLPKPQMDTTGKPIPPGAQIY